MDGRYLALLTAGLLGLASGCTQTSLMRRQDPGTTSSAQPEESAAVQHKAPTYCAFGDMVATAAMAADKTPGDRRQAREEAKLSYLKAIETDPKYLPAYLSLARMQQASEEYPAAVATLEKAIQLAPKNATLWYDLGLCQCRMKQWPESVTSLQKACDLVPGNRSYQTALGFTLGRAGRVQESLTILSQVHGEAKANYDLARMMRHMNQIPTAKQLAARAVEKDPNLPGAKQLLAELNGQSDVKPPVIQAIEQSKSVSAAENAPLPTIIQETTSRMVEGTAPQVTTASYTTTQSEKSADKSIKMPPLPVISEKK